MSRAVGPRRPGAASERRRADEIRARLEVTTGGRESLIHDILPELAVLLHAESAVGYAVSPTTSGLGLDWLQVTDPGEAVIAAEVRSALEGYAAGSLTYDPFRPAPSDRNRARHLTPREVPGWMQRICSRHGLPLEGQLRALTCEGDVLLAWLGVLRDGPFDDRERALFDDLIPDLRARLLLERRAHLAPLAFDALDVAMEAIGVPAFLVAGQSIAHANSAGRALLAHDAAGVLEPLRDHLAGRATGAFTLTRHVAPAASPHVLAVATAAYHPAEAHQAAAAAWELTPAQRRVLTLLVEGLTNKAIAAELRCSEGNVEAHVTALLAKAGCSTRSELIARYYRY